MGEVYHLGGFSPYQARAQNTAGAARDVELQTFAHHVHDAGDDEPHGFAAHANNHDRPFVAFGLVSHVYKRDHRHQFAAIIVRQSAFDAHDGVRFGHHDARNQRQWNGFLRTIARAKQQ